MSAQGRQTLTGMELIVRSPQLPRSLGRLGRPIPCAAWFSDKPYVPELLALLPRRNVAVDNSLLVIIPDAAAGIIVERIVSQ